MFGEAHPAPGYRLTANCSDLHRQPRECPCSTGQPFKEMAQCCFHHGFGSDFIPLEGSDQTTVHKEQQQEIINNNVQTALKQVEQKTEKLEVGVQEISVLKNHIDARFDNLVSLFQASKTLSEVQQFDVSTPTKPTRSRSRGRSGSQAAR